MIDIESDVVLLQTFGHKSPMEAGEFDDIDPVTCEICDSEFEWRGVEMAYCPVCQRTGRVDADRRIFALDYTFYIRK